MVKSLAFLLAGLIACGGSTKGPEGPGGAGSGSGSAAKPTGPGDVVFEVPTIEVKGVVLEPEALGSPGMPLVEAKKKTTVEKQRVVLEKTKDPLEKQAQAAILATMLYVQSKDVKGDEQKKLFADARQALRDAEKASGANVDELTLRLLGSYELLLEDYPAAEKAWSALVTKAPKDKDVIYNKAWWAYALLKQFKNAEALQVVGADPVTDKQPEHAYVTAWAKWRTGDNQGAWDAIIAAAKGWGSNAGKERLDDEVYALAGRTDVAIDKAYQDLASIPPKPNNEQRYKLFARLATQSYLLAGRWQDGVKALDKAVEVLGNKVPVDELPSLRLQQADYTVRLDDPVTSAKYAKQAIEALPACGAKCKPEEMEAVVLSVYRIAQLFHNLYASAHDDRYYQPAHDLYQLVVFKITIDQKARAEAQQRADALEKSFKGMRAGVGTHEKGTIAYLLDRHSQEIQACYERGLAANPKLGGSLVVMLESDQTGAIKGVSTEPKEGMADMALVAGCAKNRAKAWKLPSRAQPGETRITVGYSMKARQSATASK